MRYGIPHMFQRKFRVSFIVLLVLPAMADIRFTPVQPNLFADPFGQSNAWGDYDRDGDLDLVTTGQSDNQGNSLTVLYQNSSGGILLVDERSSLPGLLVSGVSWGDRGGEPEWEFARS
mgnify:CR=1 FL=1